jgi:hypothetical protein
MEASAHVWDSTVQVFVLETEIDGCGRIDVSVFIAFR